MIIKKEIIKLIFTKNIFSIEEALDEYIYKEYKNYMVGLYPIEYFIESLYIHEDVDDWYDVLMNYYDEIEHVLNKKNNNRVIIDYRVIGEGVDITTSRVIIAIQKEEAKEFIDFLETFEFQYTINPNIYEEKYEYVKEIEEEYKNTQSEQEDRDYYMRYRE